MRYRLRYLLFPKRVTTVEKLKTSCDHTKCYPFLITESIWTRRAAVSCTRGQVAAASLNAGAPALWSQSSPLWGRIIGSLPIEFTCYSLANLHCWRGGGGYVGVFGVHTQTGTQSIPPPLKKSERANFGVDLIWIFPRVTSRPPPNSLGFTLLFCNRCWHEPALFSRNIYTRSRDSTNNCCVSQLKMSED